MKQISKPHLVDLLRTCDKHKWLSPRIRYASVRSKGELVRDLQNHFSTTSRKQCVTFHPLRSTVTAPIITYSLRVKKFYFDGIPQNLPKESREKPQFSINYGSFLLTFPTMPESLAEPSKDTDTDFYSVSNTKHSWSFRLFRAKRAMSALVVNSHVRI